MLTFELVCYWDGKIVYSLTYSNPHERTSSFMITPSMQNTFSLRFSSHVIFAEITFCTSVNLEQPVMVLILCLTYQLSCGMHYLILSFKRRIQANIFVWPPFFLIYVSSRVLGKGLLVSLNYIFSYVSVYVTYFSFKCYV